MKEKHLELTESEYSRLETEKSIMVTRGQDNFFIRRRPDTPHYAIAHKLGLGRVYSDNFILLPEDKFFCWITAPKNQFEKRKLDLSPESFTSSLGFTYAFCFFCGRKREELGTNEVLTIDHILPLSEGGDDQRYNMQILCSACHKLKNWNNTYITKHLTRRGSQ